MTVSTSITTDPSWIDVGAVDDIPLRGARRLKTATGDLAIFRTGDDRIFALKDECPHRQGPLSQGIVSGHAVSCPLHNWLIDLATGEPLGADAGKGCAPIARVAVEAGRVFVSLAA
jgi:nitrite reductase (NADH) small subunit